MVWFRDWEIGVAILALCIILHGFGLVFLANIFARPKVRILRKSNIFFSAISFSLAAIIATFFHICEAAIWAIIYWKLGASPNYSSAFLHSMGAFTTYRNSAFDIGENWTLVDQLEAMNGVVAIGITVTFLYTIAGRLQNNS